MSNKRELILQKLEQKQEISTLKLCLTLSQEFRGLLNISQTPYKFNSEVLKMVKVDPSNAISELFKITQNPLIQNSKQYSSARIIFCLIEGLESNRVFPKLLAHTYIKNQEIRLAFTHDGLLEEIQLVLQNQECLLPVEDNLKMKPDEKIDQKYLIIWNLEKISPYLDKFITPNYLNNSDVAQIKIVHRRLQNIVQKYPRIYFLYDRIVKKINLNQTFWRKEPDIQERNRASILKVFLKKKFGKFCLLNLCDHNIAIPSLLRQIELQQLQDNENQEIVVEIRNSPAFMNYLTNFKENQKTLKLLELKQFEKLSNWKLLKNYYNDVILLHFNKYESISEEEAILICLDKLYELRNNCFTELQTCLKRCEVGRMIEEFQQKIQYDIKKQEKLTQNQKWIRVNNIIINLMSLSFSSFGRILEKTKPVAIDEVIDLKGHILPTVQKDKNKLCMPTLLPRPDGRQQTISYPFNSVTRDANPTLRFVLPEKTYEAKYSPKFEMIQGKSPAYNFGSKSTISKRSQSICSQDYYIDQYTSFRTFQQSSTRSQTEKKYTSQESKECPKLHQVEQIQLGRQRSKTNCHSPDFSKYTDRKCKQREFLQQYDLLGVNYSRINKRLDVGYVEFSKFTNKVVMKQDRAETPPSVRLQYNTIKPENVKNIYLGGMKQQYPKLRPKLLPYINISGKRYTKRAQELMKWLQE